jgi:hypothetical protein
LYAETVFFSTGIVIQRSLCRGGIGSVEDVQEFTRMNTLPFGSLHQRSDDIMGFDSVVGAVA